MFDTTETTTSAIAISAKTPFPDTKFQSTIDKLLSHVSSLIASNPFEFDGHVWAKCSKNDLCATLGISRHQLNRILGNAPFNFDVIIDKATKTKVTLIRLGPKGDWTPRMAAKAMKRVWQQELLKFNQGKIAVHLERIKMLEHNKLLYMNKNGVGNIAAFSFSHLSFDAQHQIAQEELASIDMHLPSQKKKLERAKLDAKNVRPVSGTEFGLLVGLARYWGPRSAARILRYLMRHWAEFMVCLKLHLNDLEGELDKDGKPYVFRFFEFPALAVMARFHKVAIEVMLTDIQETKPQAALNLVKKAKLNMPTHAFIEALTDELIGKLKDGQS